MATRLADGNTAITLLGNTLATGCILFVLITSFGRISGAHFNPAVTLSMLMERKIDRIGAALFVLVQIIGGLVGTWLAHGMFEESIAQFSSKSRTGFGQWLAEIIATFGLVLIILLVSKYRANAVALAVGLYISAAYWFTSSTSFANPAVTIARSWSDTFSGIYPAHAPMFIVMQFVGAVLAVYAYRILARDRD